MVYTNIFIKIKTGKGMGWIRIEVSIMSMERISGKKIFGMANTDPES